MADVKVVEKFGFRIGDVVRFIADEDPDHGVIRGQTGIVKNLQDDYEYECIGVEWDIEKPRYHDCNGKCKSHHGWWVPHYDLAHEIEDLGGFDVSDLSVDSLFNTTS